MILIFGDLHLDNYRRFSHILKGGINSRLNEQVEVVKKILALPLPDLTAIVFLGDLFNGQGASISKQLYLTGYKIVDALRRLAPTYLIVGNHDVYSSHQILQPFESIPDVYIVESTVQETIDMMDITMVPWGGNIPVNGDVLLGHLDIEGARTGSDYQLPGTIHPDEVKGYNLVISGHWHSRQWLNEKILFCGAVMPNDFGDMPFEDFGVTLLNSDRSTQSIKIESPYFVPIVIKREEDMQEFKEAFYGNPQLNYYKLILKDRKIEIPKFDSTVDIEWDVEEKVEARLEYSPEASVEEILCKFIDVSPSLVNKELSKQYLMGVMQEV